MRVATYARYSSDQQRAASIADQQRVCREHADRRGWTIVADYTDAELSGDTLIRRPGVRALYAAATRGEVDVVLAESLDRLSRDMEDTAGLFKRLTFAGVRVVTVSEGDITALHVGFKGTMNALYLSDLADKTRRGLRGRVAEGKSGGGVCYGYRVVKALEGQPRGDREIHAAEALVVRRIYQSFIDGVAPKLIARRLNREGVPGPRSVAWSPSTIHGHAGRGTGILNNELYVGRLVWNRLRYVKNPDTGTRLARPNPPSAWIITAVPDLRIVDDATWSAAKARQAAMRRATSAGLVHAHRPKYLFSGLTRCGSCGGGFTLSSHDHLVCFNARERGTCTNGRAMKRQELEQRVLTAMRERLFDRQNFEQFCADYLDEMTRLRRDHLANLAGRRRELTGVERRLKEIVQAIGDGFRTDSMRTELLALEARKVELTTALVVPPAAALHPSMAERFRQQALALAAGLEDPDQQDAARQALRGFIDRIIIPAEGLLRVIGNLGSMLASADGALTVGHVGCGGSLPTRPTGVHEFAA